MKKKAVKFDVEDDQVEAATENETKEVEGSAFNFLAVPNEPS
jgi:hypothetical protein